MSKFNVFLILVILHSKSDFVYSQTCTNTNNLVSVPYNYEVFALHKCHHSFNWTIHGMWPENNSSNWPSYCHVSSLDMKVLESLVARLNTDWLDCYCPKDKTCTDLWKHEWTKHGTCSHWYPSQYNYFLDGLDRYADIASRGWINNYCQATENCYFYWNPWNHSWIKP